MKTDIARSATGMESDLLAWNSFGEFVRPGETAIVFILLVNQSARVRSAHRRKIQAQVCLDLCKEAICWRIGIGKNANCSTGLGGQR
jgi:hypothetical protein